MARETLPGPVVIGLRGVAGAGKSTIQSLLVQHIEPSKRVSVAGPLKSGLATMGVTKDAWPDLYRRMAQLVGAGLREHDPDWWVQQARISWKNSLQLGLTLVVDDIRYENERDLCDYLFFIEPGFAAGLVGEQAKHESEQMNSQGAGSDVLIPNPMGAPEIAAGRIIQHIRDNPILRSKLL